MNNIFVHYILSGIGYLICGTVIFFFAVKYKETKREAVKSVSYLSGKFITADNVIKDYKQAEKKLKNIIKSYKKTQEKLETAIENGFHRINYQKRATWQVYFYWLYILIEEHQIPNKARVRRLGIFSPDPDKSLITHLNDTDKEI